jgi:chromosome partitioning protein
MHRVVPAGTTEYQSADPFRRSPLHSSSGFFRSPIPSLPVCDRAWTRGSGAFVRTFAVINRKGGSGKTTTAVNTAAALAELGQPVLLIDLDPQGTASEWLDREQNDRGLFDAFMGTRDLERLTVDTAVDRLEMIPTSEWLVTAERTLLGDLSVGVANAIGRLPPRWSFVIIDCPPALSYLSIGVLMGVREVIVPVEVHAIALSGAAAVVGELPIVRSKLNPDLERAYILPCRVNRTVHARETVDTLAEVYPDMITRTRIRENVRLAEAAGAHQPIMTYAPTSAGTQDYRTFASELLNRNPDAPPEVRRSWWRRIVGREPAAVR